MAKAMSNLEKYYCNIWRLKRYNSDLFYMVIYLTDRISNFRKWVKISSGVILMKVITKFQWGPLIYLNIYFFNIFLKFKTSLHKKHTFMEDGLLLKDYE